MDRLRRDMRDLFDRRQAGLGAVPDAGRHLMQGAMARREEPMDRRAQMIAGIAAAAMAVLMVATLAYIRFGATRPEGPVGVATPARTAEPTPKQTAQPTPASKPSPPAEAPPGKVVYDVDVAGPDQGWILLTNCIEPMTGTCQYFVAATTTGGQTWSVPVQVGGQFDPADGGAPRHVRFINASDGFAFGGTVAFVTHDAGRTWAQLDPNATFYTTIEGQGRRAWIITWPCAKAAPCSYQVSTSADGGRTWSKPASLPAGFYPYRAVAFGEAGLLLSSESPGNLEITRDGGATWAGIQSRCTGNVLESVVATSEGKELWQLCLDYPDANSAEAKRQLWVSVDGGLTWASRVVSQVGTMQAANGYFQVMAAPKADSLVMASNQSGMTITHDGGRTWTGVGPGGVGFQSIRFVSAQLGVAVDVTHGIWVTTDGGDHWSQWPADTSAVTAA